MDATPPSSAAGASSGSETNGTRAVFLSYASQDALVARQVCERLRTAGLEVWFDQNELRGGVEWDRCIRRQIRECALFIPLISANTQARQEGYFRREWNLAVERLLDMARGVPFLLPVVIDATSDRDALVPEEFLRVQWLRLAEEGAGEELTRRVQALLASRDRPPTRSPVAVGDSARSAGGKRPVPWLWPSLAFGIVLLGAAGYLGWRALSPGRPDSGKVAAGEEPSVAVLAFENFSEDRSNEYFSEGVSEDLLNALARTPGLRVAARTSSFRFKSPRPALAEIKRALGVNYLVDGSVRRERNHVRISAQLIKADGGTTLWSQTRDWELKDTLSVQDEIAHTIVVQLRRQLLGGGADGTADSKSPTSAPTPGGTSQPEAYQRFLQGRFLVNRGMAEDFEQAAEHFRAATALDPNFALAWAQLARTQAKLAQHALRSTAAAASFGSAQAAAEKALRLEPSLAEAHVVLAQIQMVRDWDPPRARQTMRRALELAPHDSWVLSTAAMLTLFAGQLEPALELCRQAARIDPINPEVRLYLAAVHYYSDRPIEAEREVRQALALSSSVALGPSLLSYVLLRQRRFEEAVAAAELEQSEMLRLVPIALIRQAQGQEQAARTLEQRLIAEHGDRMAFNIAQICAARGEVDQAFAWLERACQQHDGGLVYTKLDPFLRRLHSDPRWAALLTRLGLGPEPSGRP